MRSVRFMACAMSAAALALTAGAQSAEAGISAAGAAIAGIGMAGNAPAIEVQWGGYGYGDPFDRWKHLPWGRVGWDEGWGGGLGYNDRYGGYGYGGYDPCCNPRPCCEPPPPPPPPCCPTPYYPPEPYVPPYEPLK